MKTSTPKQNSYINRIFNYARSHRVSLGLFLASYGVFYLSSVIMSGWTVADWGKDPVGYPPSFIHALLPRSIIDPIFYVTSFPALLIGAAMLCIYSLRGIHPDASVDKQFIAILLTAFGFSYQVIGAWPLGNPVDFPWYWQKQIVGNGAFFAWILEILSFFVLVVGVISLYKHSQIYHQTPSSEEQNIGETVA